MSPEKSAGASRLAAIDWMRGFVMVLMAIDHASLMYNAGRVASDSAYLNAPAHGMLGWVPGTEIAPEQFFTRWITHLCAPTFLFLSGTSLALSLEKRARGGEAAGSLDRHLLVRGLVILGFEGLLSALAGTGALMLQVLFAIGMSLIAMIPLRRLPTPALVGLGLLWLVGGEALTRAAVPIGTVDVTAPLAITLAPLAGAPLTVVYPFVHWLAMLVLGWGFGRYLLTLPGGATGRRAAERLLLGSGLASLAVFALVRGIDAYGNMGLHRDDGSLIQWLHVSKYPPALAFATLELGLMALLLAGLLALERAWDRPRWQGNPLLVLGQTALFFYMLHFILLGAGAQALGDAIPRGLPQAYLAAGAVVLALYPACRWYRDFKRRHPRSLAQYV